VVILRLSTFEIIYSFSVLCSWDWTISEISVSVLGY